MVPVRPRLLALHGWTEPGRKIRGAPGRTPINMDDMFLAAPEEGLTVELGAVVDMDGPRQAHGRPGRLDAHRLQQRRLVEDGVQQA